MAGLAAAAALLAFCTAAAAATPAQIRDDFLAHGRLTAAYTPAELESVLHDASVQGYGGPATTALIAAARRRLAVGPTAGAAAGASSLPFTGVDLFLALAGGGGLLLLGGVLRRLGGRR